MMYICSCGAVPTKALVKTLINSPAKYVDDLKALGAASTCKSCVPAVIDLLGLPVAVFEVARIMVKSEHATLDEVAGWVILSLENPAVGDLFQNYLEDLLWDGSNEQPEIIKALQTLIGV